MLGLEDYSEVELSPNCLWQELLGRDGRETVYIKEGLLHCLPVAADKRYEERDDCCSQAGEKILIEQLRDDGSGLIKYNRDPITFHHNTVGLWLPVPV